eukprot:277228-Prorocentrum_minimum.AAC.1
MLLYNNRDSINEVIDRNLGVQEAPGCRYYVHEYPARDTSAEHEMACLLKPIGLTAACGIL